MVVMRRKPGLLGPHYEGYRQWLLGLGSRGLIAPSGLEPVRW
jgi:hypothetical protein